jgi:hypothetical protein
VQIGPDGFFHLTYCTKIHPGHGWDELFRNLRAYVPQLKENLAPDRAFGLGLRLSAQESEELLARDRMARFQEFLAGNNLYVFTLNGFPFGSFHGPRVKSEVFAPDWRERSRVNYTLRLIEILARLLPSGMEGSISTLPLSYKPWLHGEDGAAGLRITENLVEVVHRLVQVKEETGKFIHLDLEPEPDGLLEVSQEVVDFYRDWLLARGAPLLTAKAGVPLSRAGELLREHLQVCLDTCHLAVAYEDPAAALEALAQNGIRVGKVQITAGLKVPLPDHGPQRASLARELEPFARSPYLHQVIARGPDGGRRQFRDLVEALPRLAEAGDREWRIHYHMPLFVDRYGVLSCTQEETLAVLRLLKERLFCRHLEIETYTWELLPGDLKVELLESLRREYRWVLEAMGGEEAGGKMLGHSEQTIIT